LIVSNISATGYWARSRHDKAATSGAGAFFNGESHAQAGSNYEVVFGITELAPGFKSGRHSHPGLVLAYVAEGEFWYLVDGQPEKIYKVGESFQLPDRAIHNEGAAGSNPVKVMAVFVVEKGKPLVQPAQ
jgi:quercetin dioxygenase-like cupin family protein